VKILELKIPRIAYLDGLLLAGSLASINLWIAPEDFGWLNRNPSPYLLLPILIGARFGFVSGIGAGASAILIIVVGQVCLKSANFTLFFHSQAFFLTSLVLAGGVCGEIQESFQAKFKQMNALQAHLKNRLKKLDHELYFLKEAKSELDRMVAGRDTELCTLDTEIRELYSAKSEELFCNILRLLNRRASVTDAALYVLGQGPQLIRQAVLGNEQNLPEKLLPSEIEMVALAMERKTMVTIPEFWQRNLERHHNYLITFPLLGLDDAVLAVLIVTGMPFFSFNQKTVHLVSVICRWAARVMQSKNQAGDRFRFSSNVERQPIFAEKVLRQNIELSFHSYHLHNIPSALVFLCLHDMPLSLQPPFESLIMPAVRPGDCPAELSLGFPNLAVLLPLTAERNAQAFLTRVLDNIRIESSFARSLESRLFLFDEIENSDQLWEELTSYAKANAGVPG